MVTYVVAFLMSMVGALLITPVVRALATRWQWVDEPSGARHVHPIAVPRVGGIAIASAFFAPILGLYFVNTQISHSYLSSSSRMIALLMGSLAMVTLGLADDLKGISARKKLMFQTVVACCAYALGYKISFILNPWGGEVVELGLWSAPLTVLWIVGIMNAMNLIDGLDGLASGVGLFTVITLFIVALIHSNVIVGLTCVALAGALIGFLRYNFNPASIFMGDSGSLFLGYVLALTSISGLAKSSTVVSVSIPILALGLPILDTGLSIARRIATRQPVLSPDRGHIHHRLLDRGWSHRQVVFALYGFCGLCASAALAMVYANSRLTALILALIGGTVILLTRLLGYFKAPEDQASGKTSAGPKSMVQPPDTPHSVEATGAAHSPPALP